jgi:hypothetical protein
MWYYILTSLKDGLSLSASVIPPDTPFSCLSSVTGKIGPFLAAVPQDSQPYPVLRINLKAIYDEAPI